MIYIITNLVNGNRYIGKTSKTIEERWYCHCKCAEYGQQTYLYKAMRKYGIDQFKIDYLCDGLDDEEVIMIEAHNPEYNMTRGGTGGDTSTSPNYIQAMKKLDRRGSNNPMYGRRGIDNPNYGKKHGPNTKLSESKKKTIRCSNGNIFKGFQSLFDFYNVKSYYSLRKIGITWSEVHDE